VRNGGLEMGMGMKSFDEADLLDRSEVTRLMDLI